MRKSQKEASITGEFRELCLGCTGLVVESDGWRILCRILDEKRKFKSDELQNLSFTVAKKASIRRDIPW